MVNVRLVYEQLEAAKHHLLSGSILGHRLALILCDNAAELLMHRELDFRFMLDDSRAPKWEPAYSKWILAGLGPRYTPKERREAEWDFEPKLRILTFKLKTLSIDDRLILSVCHKLRGAAFHRGELRHAIMRQVSTLAYLTTTRLTMKLPPHGLTLPGNSSDSDDHRFLRRFDLADATQLLDSDGQRSIVDKLISGVEFDAPVFNQSLSSQLVDRIDATVASLEELGGTRDKVAIDRNIQYTQFWREVGAGLLEQGTRAPELEDAYRGWQMEGRAKYTLGVIARWRRQAESISRCGSPARALTQYWAIDRRFASLEDGVADAHFQHDEEINARIKMSRLPRALEGLGQD